MWTIALVVVSVTLFFLWRRRQFFFFKRLGIPGPEPNLLFGNLLEFYTKDPIQCIEEWIHKYGPIVGYYYGTKPSLLIADLDLLKKIQVSDFHKFINRPNVLGGKDHDPSKKPKRVEGFSQHLIALRDKRWKEVRSILTPSFTASKMKLMAPIINDAIDSLMNNIEKKSATGETVEMYSLYQGLTMDVIGRTAFGIQTDCQNNPNDPFIRSARLLFSRDSKSILVMVAVSFRAFETLWSKIGRLRLSFKNKGVNPVSQLINSVKKVIEQRRKDKSSRRPDLLQLMLDAEVDVNAVSSTDLTATAESEAKERTGTSTGKLQKMSDDDVLDNSVLFFLAGYETTSTALAFSTHLLLHHQDVQDKVRDEILQLLESDGNLDYSSVNKLQYLDQVLHESLRMYPPIYLFVNRECGEDVDYGKVKLPKGLAIQVPMMHIHRNPLYWPEPDKFMPERFSPENKGKIQPMAFQTFGAGPRNCVGMRFALMEAKLALARILAKYKLVPCAETDKEPITLAIGPAIMKPKYGVNLKAVPL